MVKPKRHPYAQSNKMDKYNVAKLSATSEGDREQPGNADPSLGAILEAIRDLKSSLEPKFYAMKLDVNLLQADFRKMSS
ncbi:hypothetical protein NDU88_004479 [Pleurodeles waltl]|uniref:Uncharacterized protein n=1 Tax=Pleurodeles waltl TaxID=8319 RepID=A0AAV7SIW6_PLEWA|nr:hypothetical protein NDU88_004479 [Pleurodeles waltl]